MALPITFDDFPLWHAKMNRYQNTFFITDSHFSGFIPEDQVDFFLSDSLHQVSYTYNFMGVDYNVKFIDCKIVPEHYAGVAKVAGIALIGGVNFNDWGAS